MNKRIRKKIAREWTRFSGLGERRQPRYTRDQLWTATGRRARALPWRPWKFRRKGVIR